MILCGLVDEGDFLVDVGSCVSSLSDGHFWGVDDAAIDADGSAGDEARVGEVSAVGWKNSGGGVSGDDSRCGVCNEIGRFYGLVGQVDPLVDVSSGVRGFGNRHFGGVDYATVGPDRGAGDDVSVSQRSDDAAKAAGLGESHGKEGGKDDLDVWYKEIVLSEQNSFS